MTDYETPRARVRLLIATLLLISVWSGPVLAAPVLAAPLLAEPLPEPPPDANEPPDATEPPESEAPKSEAPEDESLSTPEAEPLDEDVDPTEPAAQSTGEDDSWRTAVTNEQEEEARSLFRAGNALVRDSLFLQAAEKYEAALALWDHPGIHYNLALALLNLDQPLKLRHHLLSSLKYGEKSLGTDKARRVEQYLTLVEKQLAWIVIESEHKGARVLFDGEPVFTGPGRYEAYARPGAHTVRATASGFEPTERALQLYASERETVRLKLYKPEDWIQYSRRWGVLGPILTTVSGAAVLAAGGVTYGIGLAKVAAYDKQVEEECPDTGCAPGTIEGSADAGYRLQIAGAVGMSVGGAAAVTGAILMYMNRQIAHRVDPATKDSMSFTPSLSPTFSGLVTTGTF